MKVLLYGGCHAQVLRDYLQGALPGRVSTHLLVNFELMRAKLPFPYEQLAAYDCVVFSPIENKGDYNTDHLVEACRAQNVLPICFPWLEWHGYCPGAAKGIFKNKYQWFYPQLAELAASTRLGFDAFYEDAIARFPDDLTIDRVFALSTERLRETKRRHDAIGVTDFIGRNFQDKRLFPNPDHPCRALYIHALCRILDQIGIGDAGEEHLSDLLPKGEPQEQWRLPIFPRVARRLGLRFSDPQWRDDDMLPGCTIGLRDYLRLYYHQDGLVLAPSCDDARCYEEDGRATARVAAPLFAKPLPAERQELHRPYEILQAFSETGDTIAPGRKIWLDPAQWRSDWLA